MSQAPLQAYLPTQSSVKVNMQFILNLRVDHQLRLIRTKLGGIGFLLRLFPLRRVLQSSRARSCGQSVHLEDIQPDILP